MAQNKGGRNNHRYIAQKRNDKRRKSFTKPLQSAGSRNRNRGYDKAQTDNVQGACAERNRFGICGKSAISGFAANRQPKVPASIMAAVMASVVS